MTGGEAAPGLAPRLHLGLGETIDFPSDWLRLPLPVRSESIATWWNIAIVGNPMVRKILARGATIGLKVPSLDEMHPADLTLSWWERKWPFKEFQWVFEGESRAAALTYYLGWVFWRLVVEFFDRLRAGDILTGGRRIDVAEGGPFNSACSGLWSNPDMVMRLSVGTFHSKQRLGHPVPGRELPSFIDFVVCPPAVPKLEVSNTPAPEPTPAAPDLTCTSASDPTNGQANRVTKERCCWKSLVKRHQGTDNALKAWAIKAYGNDPPGREELLKAHRRDFGFIKGISQDAMRRLRRLLSQGGVIPDELKRGGAPTHRRSRGR